MFYCSVIIFRQYFNSGTLGSVKFMNRYWTLPLPLSQVFSSSADLAIQKELDSVPRRYHSVLENELEDNLGEI